MAEAVMSSKKYSAYPLYKDSGIEWIGRIPLGWDETKLGRLVFMQEGPGLRAWQFKEAGTRVICVTNITDNGIDFNRLEKYISNEEYLTGYRRFTVNKGDILLSSSGNSWGKVAVYNGEEKVILNTSTIRLNELKEKKVLREFLRWLLLSEPVKEQLDLAMTGACQPNFGPSHLSEVIVPIIPKVEQQKIANFLDHETAKIDTLIAKQEKLIELLKEKRQAVISHAVTRGLNPEAPMKDSGVEWLGEVPENWIVAPIKRIAELTPKKSEIANKKEFKCSFVPMDKLKQDSLVLDESKLISEVYDGYTYFKNEDVLIAKVTPCFENKNMVVARDLVNGIGFGSSEIYVLRTTKKLLNDFLYYRLQEEAFMDIATAAMTGAGGLKRVPANVITNFSIALPSKTEQTEIVVFLKKRLKQLDSLCEKAKAAIELMKERKTTLISAAVTGKIDVRNYKAEKAGI